MKRKLFAALLALIMVFGLLPITFAPKTAEADVSGIDQSIVQGGAILHCFDWSYNEIRAALPDIAAAGYVAVQTSPVQPAKDYNASWTDTKGNWWKLYQPLGFRVADGLETWLGSKEELTALCSEAEALGIYVIVDIVANHVANITGGGYTVGGTYNVSSQVDEALQDPDGSKQYYHTSENGTGDSSRYNMTQYHLSMPDLNTANKEVQQYVLDLLKECVDCGVDGFRFDAAKHIELPGDAGCGSDFWPTILNGIRDYAGADNLYMYGESLSGNGRDDAWVNEFTTYMGLTDSQTGNSARDAVMNLNAGALAASDYSRGELPKDYVIWAESHDTYEDGGSLGVSSDKIVRTWAIVGARAESTALYLARPNEIIGKASSDTSWKSTAVAEVNKFKTYYKGTGEYLDSDYDAKVTWIERGNAGDGAGAVIVKLDGAGWVSVDAHLMSNGNYEDSVSGNIFTVADGKISGNVGSTGVAVVYKTTTETPPEPPTPTTRKLYLVPNSNWLQDGARFAIYTFGNGENWYSMSAVSGETNLYVAEISTTYPKVIFCRMNPATTENNWNNKWNQTDDLTLTADKNRYTIADNTWDNGGGTWDVYGTIEGGGDDPTPVNENAGYYIVGSMTGWTVLPEFKMTKNAAVTSTDEYTLDVTLLHTSQPYRSQFKVVYSPDGIAAQSWFPEGGFNNNYGDYEGEIPLSGIYTVSFRPNYDGDASWHDKCIYAERTKYFVTVNDADRNGVVTLDKEIAAEGETVNVTVTPNEGYELDSLIYMYETGFGTGEFAEFPMTGTSFTMPAENTAVKATFIKDGTVSLADGFYLVDATNPTVENVDAENKLELFGTDGRIFADYDTYVLTGNFGTGTYQIVKVVNNAIEAFPYQEAPVVTTTGVTETVYLSMANAELYDEWTTGISSLSGYYLNTGNRPVPQMTAEYAFAETETAGVYAIEKTFEGYEAIFVCELQNGRYIARFPAGSYDDNSIVKFLDYDIYGSGRQARVLFNPNGNVEGWFGGYFIDLPLYTVTIDNTIENGTVTADKSAAEEGETVTLTVTPANGYELTALQWVYEWETWDVETWSAVQHVLETPIEGNTFEMPAHDVTVKAIFTKLTSLTDGYYLIGPDWTTDAILLDNKFVENPDAAGEYMLAATLNENDQIKVVKVEGGAITVWYPDGEGTEYTVDAAHAGDVTIYFKPTYNNEWTAFGGYFYVEIKNAAPSFEKQSLVLEGMIGVNFYMDLSALTAEEMAASYMTFTISNRGTVSSDKVMFDANKKNEELGLYGFTVYITSIQMADTITATFHYTKDGQEQTINKTYSVEEYFAAYEAKKDQFTPEQQKLIEALANYGYYVQEYLEPVKAWTFGEDGYTKMTKKYALNTDVNYASIPAFDKSGSETNGITYLLVLDSSTAIRVFFNPSDSFDELQVSVDGGAAFNVQKRSDGRFVVEIENILAQDLANLHTITVSGSKNGKTYNATVKVSALSYARSLAEASADAAWQNVAAAIYAYYKAAADYVAVNP